MTSYKSAARLLIGAPLMVAISLCAAAVEKNAKPKPREFQTESEAKKVFESYDKTCNDGTPTEEAYETILDACNQLLKRFTPLVNELWFLSDDGYANVHASRAYILYKQRKFDGAKAAAEESLKYRKNASLAYFVRGAIAVDRAEYDQALPDLTISIKIYDWAYARIVRGKAYDRLDNHDAALADFNSAVSRLENSEAQEKLFEALEARAQLFIGMERPDDALRDYASLAKVDPNNPDWDRHIAEILLKGGNAVAALEAANRAISISPIDGYGYLVRYQIYKSDDPKVRDIDKAIKDLTFVIGKSEDKTAGGDSRQAIRNAFLGMMDGGYDDLAKLYAEKKDWRGALEAINKDIKNSEDARRDVPANPAPVHSYIARSFYQQMIGDLDAARVDAQRAVEITFKKDGAKGMANGADHRRLAEVYIAQGDAGKGLNYFASKMTPIMEALNIDWLDRVLDFPSTKEAAEKYADLVQDMKDNLPAGQKGKLGASLDCNVGQALSKFDPERALKVFATLHESMDYCSYNGEALIYGRTRNLKEQLATYDAYVSRNPDATEFILRRGYLHLAMGNLDKAMADARELKRLKPNYGSGPALEARVEEARGGYSKVLAMADTITKNYKSWGMGHNLKARALLKMKKPDMAVAAAEKAVEIDGAEAEFLHTLAQAYQANGKADDAWLTYLKVIGQPSPEEHVTAFQYALAQAGLYNGPVNGMKSSELETALELCAKKTDCSLVAER